MTRLYEFFPPHAFRFKVGGVFLPDPIAGAVYANNTRKTPAAAAPATPGFNTGQMAMDQYNAKMAAKKAGTSSGWYADGTAPGAGVSP